ncbi:N-acetyl-gamma-glutamyl-phosphate reductase [Altererythrobacter aurantiacus]|uniref:N-acetyl-gamma-glutamyl-phosphate reductase n=1 Tax=Parapontixanthobacter aurantiacus TaxID=1463599 RepID=A0A844ZG18_9SPHN|nr:N-acetyl-gamma-glutamyl-phosphate reductase [Parapontixanthobacter aurantiacus]
MAARIFIDGAAGTTGIEIRDRLAGRSDVELLLLPEDRRKDASARRELLNAADIAILCLPDDAAREAVALIENAQTRVIDASSAHRVTDGWTYGFPELIGMEKVRDADRVSNPGCYPTGFLALLAPLTGAGLLRTDYPYSVNAVSGYSGGGKALIERFEQAPELAFRGYAYGGEHKHLPEMQTYAWLNAPPVFAPSVIPAFRGMIVEIPLTAQALGKASTMSELRAYLADFYAAGTVINVEAGTEPPSELLIEDDKDPSDGMTLWVFPSPDEQQARLVALLDNLGKGASGAAIQSLNLMIGAPETEGLRLPGC